MRHPNMVTEHKFNCKEDICAKNTRLYKRSNATPYAWREEVISTVA
jgi:hypothetical protein